MDDFKQSLANIEPEVATSLNGELTTKTKVTKKKKPITKLKSLKEAFRKNNVKINKGDYNHDQASIKNIHYNLAEIVKSMDFGCDFIKGVCKKDRAEKGKNPRACCNDCASNAGYLKIVNKAEVESYAKYWDPEKGFWSKSRGCRLRYTNRSSICLAHRCYHIISNSQLTPQDKRILNTVAGIYM